MKIYLYLMFIMSVFFSCKKKTDSPKPCKGYFLGMASLNRYLGLYRFTTDTFPRVHEYRRFTSDELIFGKRTFNSQLKIYYCFMILKSENKIKLIQHHIYESDMQDHDVSYSGSLDSFIKSADFPNTLLLCNSKANKLYLVHFDDWIDKTTDKIFELNISGGNCTESLLYTTPQDVSIGSPTLDDNTGLIFFVNNNKLLKIEATGGATPIAIDLKNVKPCGLHFESADRMIYGVDTAMVPAKFVKIDPNSGDITVLSELPFLSPGYYFHHTIDNCSKQYIIFSGGDIRNIDLFSGKIAEEKFGMYHVGYPIHINE